MDLTFAVSSVWLPYFKDSSIWPHFAIWKAIKIVTRQKKHAPNQFRCQSNPNRQSLKFNQPNSIRFGMHNKEQLKSEIMSSVFSSYIIFWMATPLAVDFDSISHTIPKYVCVSLYIWYLVFTICVCFFLLYIKLINIAVTRWHLTILRGKVDLNTELQCNNNKKKHLWWISNGTCSLEMFVIFACAHTRQFRLRPAMCYVISWGIYRIKCLIFSSLLSLARALAHTRTHFSI